MKGIYFYKLYERVWHWMQAAAILVLLLTGLAIHWPGAVGILPFQLAVTIHNGAALVLIAVAVIGLASHIATGAIRHYLPAPRGMLPMLARQARFYLHGMFRDEPHPFERTPEQKFNPLQKVTYFGLLNVLLPLQIASGALMWSAQQWPASLAGLPFGLLAKVHIFCGLLFAAFLIGHLYLITTGHTPTSNLKAMITGYDHIHEHKDGDHAIEQHAAA